MPLYNASRMRGESFRLWLEKKCQPVIVLITSNVGTINYLFKNIGYVIKRS